MWLWLFRLLHIIIDFDIFIPLKILFVFVFRTVTVTIWTVAFLASPHRSPTYYGAFTNTCAHKYKYKYMCTQKQIQLQILICVYTNTNTSVHVSSTPVHKNKQLLSCFTVVSCPTGWSLLLIFWFMCCHIFPKPDNREI